MAKFRQAGGTMPDLLLAVLRAVHILGAVTWAGGSFVLAAFHEYVIDPGDPERTIQRMAEYDRMSTMVGASGIVGIIAGLVLYWIVSDGINPGWVTSPYGLTITVGAVAGLAAVAVAFPMVAQTNERSKELYAELQDGRELTEDDAETIEALYDRLRRGERWMSVLLIIAVLAMAIAQYV